MSIHIGSDKQVVVKVPVGTPDSVSIAFIKEKRTWILKQIEKVERQAELAREMGALSADDIKEIRKKAKVLIPQRVAYYAELSGISYNRIFIRLQKSRWGSCSREGNLNFNCLLVLMPLEILDSVVVHELCHRRHMDHSKAFYAEVLSIFPDYKRCDKWLKQNGGVYFKRIENAGEQFLG
ncbi:MAG: M48 family metallopeptidase [Treponema sp.]|nr:M48 family metallopeptidase [Candidatus Treponema equifaecale]